MMETESETRKAPQVPQRQQPNAPPPEYELPPSAPVDRGPEVVATTLAPQLGSDTEYLSRGGFDMRKLSIINERDVPLLIYAKIRGKKSASWKSIYEEFLALQVSIGGRGRRDIIRMEGVSKGGLPDTYAEDNKPGWLSRNITDRDWKKRDEDNKM